MVAPTTIIILPTRVLKLFVANPMELLGSHLPSPNGMKNVASTLQSKVAVVVCSSNFKLKTFVYIFSFDGTQIGGPA